MPTTNCAINSLKSVGRERFGSRAQARGAGFLYGRSDMPNGVYVEIYVYVRRSGKISYSDTRRCSDAHLASVVKQFAQFSFDETMRARCAIYAPAISLSSRGKLLLSARHGL